MTPTVLVIRLVPSRPYETTADRATSIKFASNNKGEITHISASTGAEATIVASSRFGSSAAIAPFNVEKE